MLFKSLKKPYFNYNKSTRNQFLNTFVEELNELKNINELYK